MFDESSTPDAKFEIEEPTPSWISFFGVDWISWMFPLTAIVLFEWFANPAVSIVVACLKFGYADFRTAHWLRGDPDTARGTCLGFCYTSRGFYVVSFWAFVLTFALAVCEPLFQQNPLAHLDSFIAGMVLWFMGVFLGTAAGGLAVTHIAQLGRKVWMDPTIHAARRENRRWSVCHGSRNGYRWICVAVTAVCVGVTSIMVIGALTTGELEVLIGGGVLFGLPSLWCLDGVWRSWHLAAASPDECWGESV